MGLIRSAREGVTLRGFPAGILNRVPETDVPKNEAGAPIGVRDSTNVDYVGPEGQPRRRAGATKVLTLTDGHSFFADPTFPFGLAREADTLIAINSELQTAVLATGLGSGEASYALHNDEVLWTVPGVRTGRIAEDLSQRALGLPRPPGVPALAPAAGGGMHAGRYQVALTYANEDGEESGATLAATIDLSEGQGLTVSLPDPGAGEIEWVQVWITEANGNELFHARDAAAGSATIGISHTPRGRPLKTQHLDALPAGHLVRAQGGYLWMANDNELLHSQPLRALYHPGFDRIGFRSTITMMEPIGRGSNAGLYIGTAKRIYWHPGAVPKEQEQTVPRKQGAVPGTGLLVDARLFGPEYSGDAAFWMGTDGVPCLGLPGGQIIALGADTVAMSRFERGATLQREISGKKQLVVSGRGATRSTTATADSVEVFQFRTGIPVP
jgi:hypothetical protein